MVAFSAKNERVWQKAAIQPLWSINNLACLCNEKPRNCLNWLEPINILFSLIFKMTTDVVNSSVTKVTISRAMLWGVPKIRGLAVCGYGQGCQVVLSWPNNAKFGHFFIGCPWNLLEFIGHLDFLKYQKSFISNPIFSFSKQNLTFFIYNDLATLVMVVVKLAVSGLRLQNITNRGGANPTHNRNCPVLLEVHFAILTHSFFFLFCFIGRRRSIYTYVRVLCIFSSIYPGIYLFPTRKRFGSDFSFPANSHHAFLSVFPCYSGLETIDFTFCRYYTLTTESFCHSNTLTTHWRQTTAL